MLAASPAVAPYDGGSISGRNSLQRLGAFCILIYVFLVYSRILELVVLKLHVNLYLMPLVLFICLATTALAGRLPLLFTEKALRSYILLLFWMTIGVPFSIWRGGSVPIMIGWYRIALICVALIGLVETTDDCRKAMVAVALSMFVILFVGFTTMPSAEVEESRFSFDSGSLSNANEFANHILIGLPFCSALFAKRSKLMLKRLLYAILFAGGGFLLMKTGSRGGIVTASVLGLIVFWAAPVMRKFQFAVAGALLVFVAISVTPASLLERYKSIFSDTGRLEAIQSKASRLELLQASLRITARYPIFGVGAGNFMVALNEERSDVGLSGHWEVTHNAYTEVSSENGIPALIFYVGTFAICLKSLLGVRKRTRKLPQFAVAHHCASILILAIVAYMVSGMFTSNAHQFYLPLLTGFSGALIRAANQELAAYKAASQPIEPSILPPRPRARPHALATHRI